uniref:Uncharacterized protein n=1 Tax=Timema poppense TaxID=170557 RepID=A0A7R9H6R0_TIMPO|nr:unnamed protein product [Timema poppensis]
MTDNNALQRGNPETPSKIELSNFQILRWWALLFAPKGVLHPGLLLRLFQPSWVPPPSGTTPSQPLQHRALEPLTVIQDEEVDDLISAKGYACILGFRKTVVILMNLTEAGDDDDDDDDDDAVAKLKKIGEE